MSVDNDSGTLETTSIFQLERTMADRKAKRYMTFHVTLEGILGIALLALVLSDIDEDGYASTKGCLFVAGGIKLFIKIPLYVIAYRLWLMRKLSSGLYSMYVSLLAIIYLPWSIFCMIHFFDHVHDLKDDSVQMYIGMLFLWIEGFVVMTMVLLIIMITMFLIILAYSRSIDREQEESNNSRVAQIMRRLDVFHISTRHQQFDDICWLCSETMVNNKEVYDLKCDSKHKFHTRWICEWIKTSAKCPICKAVVSDEWLSHLRSKIDEISSSSEGNGQIYNTGSHNGDNSSDHQNFKGTGVRVGGDEAERSNLLGSEQQHDDSTKDNR